MIFYIILLIIILVLFLVISNIYDKNIDLSNYIKVLEQKIFQEGTKEKQFEEKLKETTIIDPISIALKELESEEVAKADELNDEIEQKSNCSEEIKIFLSSHKSLKDIPTIVIKRTYKGFGTNYLWFFYPQTIEDLNKLKERYKQLYAYEYDHVNHLYIDDKYPSKIKWEYLTETFNGIKTENINIRKNVLIFIDRGDPIYYQKDLLLRNPSLKEELELTALFEIDNIEEEKPIEPKKKINKIRSKDVTIQAIEELKSEEDEIPMYEGQKPSLYDLQKDLVWEYYNKLTHIFCKYINKKELEMDRWEYSKIIYIEPKTRECARDIYRYLKEKKIAIIDNNEKKVLMNDCFRYKKETGIRLQLETNITAKTITIVEANLYKLVNQEL